MRNLRRHVRGPVVVLWDGLAGHRSRETREYIAAQKHWLTVERFPAYAPELNPLEALWATLKGKEGANHSPDGMTELDGHLRRSIRPVRLRDMGLSSIKHVGLVSDRDHKRC